MSYVDQPTPPASSPWPRHAASTVSDRRAARRNQPSGAEPDERAGAHRRIRFFADLADTLIPDLIQLDPDLHRRARLLVVSSLALCCVGVFFGVLMLVVAQGAPPGGRYPLSSYVVMFGGSVLILGNVLLLRLTKSVSFAGFMLCIEALAVLVFQAMQDAGLEDSALLWCIIIPWLAAFLIGPLSSFVFAGLSSAVIGIFYVLETSGYVFPETSGSNMQLFYMLSASMVSMFIGYLGWLYEGQTLKNLRDANRNLLQAHAALKSSNQRIERILESITDAFFALDRSWHLTYVNQQAERILGQRRGDLLSRNVRELFTGGMGERILEKFWIAAKHGEALHFDTFYPPLDRWFSVHVYPYGEGLSVYFSDITERKAYEEQLIEAKEQAEDLAHLKSAFLTNMSHEIRTPLAGIIGLADTLRHEVGNEHREFAGLIEQSAQRLMGTLSSILDLAQLESGAVSYAMEYVDVVHEAEEVCRLLEPLARKRDLYLKVENTAENPYIQLNASFLNRILHNLVGNAIKFTNEGGITVHIGGDAQEVWIQVIDTGIGIPEGFMPYLFEEFRQASTGLNRSHEGSGLGLAITKRLVDELRGVMEVTSSELGGTTFTIHFPRL